MSWILRITLAMILIVLLDVYFARRLYSSFSVVFSGFSRKKIKRLIIISTVFLNLYPILLAFNAIYQSIAGVPLIAFGDNSFLNYLMIYPFWIFVTLVFQCMIFILPIDLIRFISYPFFVDHKAKIRNFVNKIVFTIFLVFTIYVPSRTFYDLNSIEITEFEYTKNDLADNLEDFKIVLLADMQADHYTTDSRLQEYVDKVNSIEPDLVLIAGDIITSTPQYISKAANYLGQIKSKNGVYACVGDHDNWAYRGDYIRSLSEVMSALDSVNIPMIDNDNLIVEIDTTRIGMTFVTDNYVTRISPQRLDSLAAANHLDFKIFITHQPNQRMLDKAIEYDYNLFFAGHTHGGQISLFTPFGDLSVSLIETKYVKGDFWFDKLLMVVNRGLGVSIAPIRYNSTAEVSLIRLKK